MALSMSPLLQMKTLSLGQVIDTLLVCVAHDISPVEPPEPHSGRRRRQAGAMGLARKNRLDLSLAKLTLLFGSESVYHSVHRPKLPFPFWLALSTKRGRMTGFRRTFQGLAASAEFPLMAPS
jgi:hypothetical protein